MSTYLPEDVILKILERLPIKSLIRFTCVSKRWKFYILSDPQLAKSQFQIAYQQQALGTRLFISSTQSKSGFESLGLDTLSSSSRELICPFKQHGRCVRILRSCNGLVLATIDSKSMYLWNPSTGFFKKITDLKNYVDSYRLQFGYVSAIDDYKLLVLRKKLNKWQKHRAEIFSFRADAWKRIEYPLGYRFNLADLDVVAFDLAKEAFRRMSMPTGFYRGNNWWHRRLGPSYRGCLCAFDYSDINIAGIDLWIMREYGVADSWTKLFNIKISSQPVHAIYFCIPIIVSETSIVLLIYEDLIISSIHEQQKLETCIRKNIRLDGCVIVYAETTMSLLKH